VQNQNCAASVIADALYLTVYQHNVAQCLKCTEKVPVLSLHLGHTKAVLRVGLGVVVISHKKVIGVTIPMKIKADDTLMPKHQCVCHCLLQ